MGIQIMDDVFKQRLRTTALFEMLTCESTNPIKRELWALWCNPKRTNKQELNFHTWARFALGELMKNKENRVQINEQR